MSEDANVRDSEEYKALTPYLATGLAEGFEQGTQAQKHAAWQYLHDTGLAYTLQGWFGREARNLIEAGVIAA